MINNSFYISFYYYQPQLRLIKMDVNDSPFSENECSLVR